MDLDDAWRLGRGLLDQHGLADWTLRYDRAVRRAGACRSRERVISLSAPLTAVHDEATVRDTLLHEVAHALAGPRAGHGPRWRSMALAVGATPSRCLDDDAPRIAGRWLGTCPRGHTIDRHRRPTRVLSCRLCSARFDPGALFRWTRDGVGVPDAQMPEGYVAELALLREHGAGALGCACHD